MHEPGYSPLLCLSFRLFHTAMLHWKNAFDIQSTKFFPTVEELSPDQPSECVSKKANNSLYKRWLEYMRWWAKRDGNDTNDTCVFLMRMNGFIIGLEEATCACEGRDVNLKVKVWVENDSTTNETL